MAKIVTESIEDNVIEPRRITSLSDLPARETIVRIEMEDGTIEFTCRALTYKRWNELGRMVSDPEPGVRSFDSLKRPIFNLTDPAYVNAKEMAGEKRLYYRLIEFLILDIPGDTTEEKVTSLEGALEFGVMKALIQAMQQTALTGEVSVNVRASTFHTA